MTETLKASDGIESRRNGNRSAEAKSSNVIPAQAGRSADAVHTAREGMLSMGSRLRGNDGFAANGSFGLLRWATRLASLAACLLAWQWAASRHLNLGLVTFQ